MTTPPAWAASHSLACSPFRTVCLDCSRITQNSISGTCLCEPGLPWMGGKDEQEVREEGEGCWGTMWSSSAGHCGADIGPSNQAKEGEVCHLTSGAIPDWVKTKIEVWARWAQIYFLPFLALGLQAFQPLPPSPHSCLPSASGLSAYLFRVTCYWILGAIEQSGLFCKDTFSK